jgi:hypothetical protein
MVLIKISKQYLLFIKENKNKPHKTLSACKSYNCVVESITALNFSGERVSFTGVSPERHPPLCIYFLATTINYEL